MQYLFYLLDKKLCFCWFGWFQGAKFKPQNQLKNGKGIPKQNQLRCIENQTKQWKTGQFDFTDSLQAYSEVKWWKWHTIKTTKIINFEEQKIKKR